VSPYSPTLFSTRFILQPSDELLLPHIGPRLSTSLPSYIKTRCYQHCHTDFRIYSPNDGALRTSPKELAHTSLYT
jgi:hypothetical protein